MLLQNPWSWDYLLSPFYETMGALFVSSIVFIVSGQLIPIPEEACFPENRGIDTAVNRFIGIVLIVTACFLGYGFYYKGFVSGALTLITFSWGLWITLLPFEDGRSYSIAAICFPDEYDTVSVSDIKKLFNMWIKRMNKREKAEKRSAQGNKSYEYTGSQGAGQERSQGYQSKDRQEETYNESTGGQSYQQHNKAAYTTVDSPWEVIGVEPGTPFKEVRKKWMELCKRYHPDLVPSGLKYETEEALKKVNVAYRQIRESMSKK